MRKISMSTHSSLSCLSKNKREGTVYMTLKGYMSYWNIATGRWYRKGQADRYRMHRREKVQFT